jgi:cyclohexyl-isocyanide hydratase
MSIDMAESTLQIGLLLFPRLTQMDLTAPYEVFARARSVEVSLIGTTRSAQPVRSEWGLAIQPTHTLETAPALDVICVPGGRGVNALLEDDTVLEFLRRQASGARYVTAVCTGALLLGAAGLLRGYRATTHWLSMDLLKMFGAEPVSQRVVVDRNRVTGAGVSAGIEFALRLVAALRSEGEAREIQLMLEYDPAPPFASGSPRVAEPTTIDRVRADRAESQAERRRLAERAAARLHGRE